MPGHNWLHLVETAPGSYCDQADSIASAEGYHDLQYPPREPGH